eukprot:SAG31_NODE_546_length_14230_cov_18.112660_13_plen_71_part_00
MVRAAVFDAATRAESNIENPILKLRIISPRTCIGHAPVNFTQRSSLSHRYFKIRLFRLHTEIATYRQFRP